MFYHGFVRVYKKFATDYFSSVYDVVPYLHLS